MSLATSRRALLTGGCALAALLALPAEACAARGPAAPRASCPHDGCRHHRPDADGGVCALSLDRPPLPPDPHAPQNPTRVEAVARGFVQTKV